MTAEVLKQARTPMQKRIELMVSNGLLVDQFDPRYHFIPDDEFSMQAKLAFMEAAGGGNRNASLDAYDMSFMHREDCRTGRIRDRGERIKTPKDMAWVIDRYLEDKYITPMMIGLLRSLGLMDKQNINKDLKYNLF